MLCVRKSKSGDTLWGLMDQSKPFTYHFDNLLPGTALMAEAVLDDGRPICWLVTALFWREMIELGVIERMRE